MVYSYAMGMDYVAMEDVEEQNSDHFKESRALANQQMMIIKQQLKDAGIE
jgi:hypothetical protein